VTQPFPPMPPDGQQPGFQPFQQPPSGPFDSPPPSGPMPPGQPPSSSPQPRLRSHRQVGLWVGAVVLLFIVCGGIANAIGGGTHASSKSGGKTPVAQASPTPTPTTIPTATPTPIATSTPTSKPKPTTTSEPPDYTTWLAVEVEVMNSEGATVMDAIYPNNNHQIIWVQISVQFQDFAQEDCGIMARDYVDTFHKEVVVHIYESPGYTEEVTRCDSEP
jgi:hypothetical protein